VLTVEIDFGSHLVRFLGVGCGVWSRTLKARAGENVDLIARCFRSEGFLLDFEHFIAGERIRHESWVLCQVGYVHCLA